MIISMLDAQGFRETGFEEGGLRWAFITASAEETRSLAAAFAAAVMPESGETAELRIGLESHCRRMVGKSTFAQAMLEAAGEKTSVEEAASPGPQNVWETTRKGWIRHYDCGYGASWASAALPSYWHNDKSKLGLPLTDIVEHPAKDIHDTRFDFLVTFNREAWSNRREVTVEATPEQAARPAFQKFVSAFSSWIDRPRPRCHVGL